MVSMSICFYDKAKGTWKLAVKDRSLDLKALKGSVLGNHEKKNTRKRKERKVLAIVLMISSSALNLCASRFHILPKHIDETHAPFEVFDGEPLTGTSVAP
jgi:hypothetical protein